MTALFPKPTSERIEELGRRFDADRDTALVESALHRLLDQFPLNEDVRDVVLKVATINALYSTRIYALVDLAGHITAQGIDPLLAAGDPEAVKRIARIRFSGDGKERHIYSFASKYGSWHNQTAFPIYDSRARRTLWKYWKQDKFYEFSTDDLWCYSGYAKFREIVDAFRSHYGLTEFNYKEVDKFLYWFDLLGNYDPAPLT